MPQSSDSQSDFHSNPVDEFEILLTQSKYFRIYKVRVGVQWMIRKEVRPEFKSDSFLKDLLRKEFNIGLQCNHPNIPKYFFLKENENDCLLYLEYIDGKSLEELQSAEVLTTLRTIEFAIQIINTLVYLKIKGVVYRDLHPGNILYNQQDNKYYLIDFGFAYTKDYTEINGGREAYQNKELSDEAKLIFGLERIISTCLKYDTREDNLFAKRFSEFCRKNNFNIHLEAAQEWILSNTNSAYNKNIFKYGILSLVLLGAGFLSWNMINNYASKNPEKNLQIEIKEKSTDSILPRLKQETPVFKTEFNKQKKDYNIDSFRFIFKFLAIKNKLDNKQLLRLRNQLILESDIKFKKYISTISDSTKIKSLLVNYNKLYYADFLESQKWIDKAVEVEAKTENK